MKETKQKINILIMSDIHLGSDLLRVKKAIETLNKYEFKKLILNGDIFDDLNLKRLGHEHWEVLTKIREISRVAEVVWVIGNHDGDPKILSDLMGVKIYRKYIYMNVNLLHLMKHHNKLIELK